ncbi:MAG TPA: HD domain-containing protein, partial [Gammaproteobacteria bacterium]|nr:HD domain-containing protein [Gammaproteobacteria bacterium]
GENRLLFDVQPRVAEMLGYRARSGALAVEALMQDYYRSAGAVARALDLLAASLRENPGPTRPLETALVARGAFLDFDRRERPLEQPSLMLDVFTRWQREPGLRALAPEARRAIAVALPRLDAQFRRNRENRERFLRLISAPQRVAAALAAMHEAGVLGRYIPAFARISWRMQYDLFHIFTVDEHILRVVANVENLRGGRFEPAGGDLRHAAERIDCPEVLYLAALFHDIAKGRDGDHSLLGAREARRFAADHGLAPSDAELVAWLVRNHLLLSLTAQKSDLSDPAVIADFARKLGDQRRLDYLYVLTAADVRATNPALWNSWRQTLFAELYLAASRALWRGLDHPADSVSEIAARKRDARSALGGGNPAVSRLWRRFGENYFLQYTIEEIAWHTRELLAGAGAPAVFLRPAPIGAGTSIAVYAARGIFAFARVTSVLGQLGLNVAAARCVPIGNDETLDTYWVFENDGSTIEDPRRVERIEVLLAEELARESATRDRAIRPTPRQVRLFDTPTRISFVESSAGRCGVFELHAGDHPGLLAAVARAFRRCDVYLLAARIMTVGERAEDVFHVSDGDGRALDAGACTRLESALREEIASDHH